MPKGETASQLLGSVLGETFRLERVIGEGGWGAVFEAAHLRLRRRFAIKLLYPEIAAETEALKRFRQEALVTSELGHPHIVEVVDLNYRDDGSPYIVMELLEGEDLHDRLERDKRLPLEQVNRLLGQMASALQVAHDSNVVHRDLKPRNVFLARVGQRADVVKLLDFGISKVLNAATRLTADQTLMGTPSYMAPEQAEGRTDDVAIATDIWALGALVFKMLSGRPPFVGGSVPELLDRILNQPAPKLHELVPGLPPPISEVIDVALRKRPEQRHATVAVFQRAFRRAAGAAGEPGVAITEPPAPERGQPTPPSRGARVLPAVSRGDAALTPLETTVPPPPSSTTAVESATSHERFPDTLRSEPIAAQAPEPPAPVLLTQPKSAPAGAPIAGSADGADHGKPSKQTMNEYGSYVKTGLSGRVLLVLVLLALAAAGGLVTYLAFRQ